MGDVLDDIGDAFTEAVDVVGSAVADGIEAIGDGLVEVGNWTAEAASDIGEFLDDATSKDGWLTNFVTDWVPGGGLVTAGIHAAAGNYDYAEYAAVKGASTLATAAAAAAGGVLLGPAGAILLGAAVGAGTTLFESGMKQYLRASVKDKIADLSLDGVLIGAAAGGAASGLGKGLGAIKKLGTVLKKGARGIRNTGRKIRGKPPLPPATPKPPGKIITKLKDVADKVSLVRRNVTARATAPIKKTWRGTRNRIRKLRGKPPLKPTIGPLTRGATIKKELVSIPVTGIKRVRKEDKLQGRLRPAAPGLAPPGKPQAEGCLKQLIAVLVAILIGILIAILILVFTGSDSATSPPNGGVLRPSDKGSALTPPVPLPPVDAAPIPAPDPETPASTVTPDQNPPVVGNDPIVPPVVNDPPPVLETLRVNYRKPVCSGRDNAVEALIGSPAGNNAPFSITFSSNIVGVRQVSSFTATQGEVFFVMPVTGAGEILEIQSLVVGGVEYTSDWGSYTTTLSPDAPCDPTATTTEVATCWSPQAQSYYLGIAFASPASPGQTAVLILTADAVGQGDPDTATVEADGRFFFVIPNVEPGWTITVVSLTIDGRAYDTVFSPYLVPQTDFVC